MADTPLSSMFSTSGASAAMPAAKGKAKAAAKQGQGAKRTHSEGPGKTTPTKQSGNSVSGQAKVDTATLISEAERTMSDINTLTTMESFSLEAAQNLGTRLQVKSRSLAKKPGNTEAVNLLHDVNRHKKIINAVVLVLKAVGVWQKSKKRANCKTFMEAFDEMLAASVDLQTMAPCILVTCIYAQVWCHLGDSRFLF